MLSLMSAQRALFQAAQTGRIQQERLHTEDPARFYRHRWLRDGVPLTGYEARTLDDLFTEDKIAVSWAGVMGIGVQPVTAR